MIQVYIWNIFAYFQNTEFARICLFYKFELCSLFKLFTKKVLYVEGSQKSGL